MSKVWRGAQDRHVREMEIVDVAAGGVMSIDLIIAGVLPVMASNTVFSSIACYRVCGKAVGGSC
jgi:hypothetical protein